jgi:hypothetical protein
MTRGRLATYFAGTAVVAALFGFLFGYYQAYPAEHARNRAMLRLRLSEARARTLDGQVALVRANYGNAREHLTEAVRLLDAFKATDQSHLPPTEAAKIDQAMQHLRDAMMVAPGAQTTADTAGMPSPDQASTRAEQAANLLGEVYRATPEP